MAGEARKAAEPLRIGTVVRGHGKIVGIRFDGERYYFMSDRNGVSFMPADVIEHAAQQDSANEGE